MATESYTDYGAIFVMIFWIFAGLLIIATIFLSVWQAKQGTTTSAIGTAGENHTPEASIESDGGKHLRQEQQQNTVILVEDNHSRRIIHLILPTLSALIALCFSFVPLASCKYIGIDSQDYSILSFGLWFAYGPVDSSGYKTCFSIVNNVKFDVDMAMTAARLFSVLSTTLGALAFLCLVYFLVNQHQRLRRGRMMPSAIALLFVLAVIFEVATLVVKRTHFCDEASCSLEVAAYAAITASIYWVVALGGIISFLLV